MTESTKFNNLGWFEEQGSCFNCQQLETRVLLVVEMDLQNLQVSSSIQVVVAMFQKN